MLAVTVVASFRPDAPVFRFTTEKEAVDGVQGGPRRKFRATVAECGYVRYRTDRVRAVDQYRWF